MSSTLDTSGVPDSQSSPADLKLQRVRERKENAMEALRLSELEVSLCSWQARLREMESKLRSMEASEVGRIIGSTPSWSSQQQSAFIYSPPYRGKRSTSSNYESFPVQQDAGSTAPSAPAADPSTPNAPPMTAEDISAAAAPPVDLRSEFQQQQEEIEAARAELEAKQRQLEIQKRELLQRQEQFWQSFKATPSGTPENGSAVRHAPRTEHTVQQQQQQEQQEQQQQQQQQLQPVATAQPSTAESLRRQEQELSQQYEQLQVEMQTQAEHARQLQEQVHQEHANLNVLRQQLSPHRTSLEEDAIPVPASQDIPASNQTDEQWYNEEPDVMMQVRSEIPPAVTANAIERLRSELSMLVSGGESPALSVTDPAASPPLMAPPLQQTGNVYPSPSSAMVNDGIPSLPPVSQSLTYVPNALAPSLAVTKETIDAATETDEHGNLLIPMEQLDHLRRQGGDISMIVRGAPSKGPMDDTSPSAEPITEFPPPPDDIAPPTPVTPSAPAEHPDAEPAEPVGGLVPSAPPPSAPVEDDENTGQGTIEMDPAMLQRLPRHTTVTPATLAAQTANENAIVFQSAAERAFIEQEKVEEDISNRDRAEMLTLLQVTVTLQEWQMILDFRQQQQAMLAAQQALYAAQQDPAQYGYSAPPPEATPYDAHAPPAPIDTRESSTTRRSRSPAKRLPISSASPTQGSRRISFGRSSGRSTSPQRNPSPKRTYSAPAQEIADNSPKRRSQVTIPVPFKLSQPRTHRGSSEERREKEYMYEKTPFSSFEHLVTPHSNKVSVEWETSLRSPMTSSRK